MIYDSHTAAALHARTIKNILPEILHIADTGKYKDYGFREIGASAKCSTISRGYARCEWRIRLIAQIGNQGMNIFERQGMSEYRAGKFTLDRPALRRREW